MKNKKGFTLIELLAVIVVLAIIALIATPIVMNTIKNAKKGAAERSADSYIKQVETAIAEARLGGDDIPNGTYTIDSDGNLTGTRLPNGKLTIDMKGNKPTSGMVAIKDGSVSQSGTIIKGGDYKTEYKDGKLTTAESYKGILCRVNTEKVTALVWNGTMPPLVESTYNREEVGLLASEAISKYDIGVTYTCELGDGEENTFYVLETNGDNVSLILGMNLGEEVEWCSKEDYKAAGGNNEYINTPYCQGSASVSCATSELGPITANKALMNRTKGWTKVDVDKITLPTYNQIYKAAGNKTTDLPTWLISYTKIDEAEEYWLQQYLTSTASSDKINSFSVGPTGLIHGIVDNNYASIRPVITILKSQLG